MSTECTDDEKRLVKVATDKFRSDVKTYAMAYHLPELDVDFNAKIIEAERAGRWLAFNFMHSVYFMGQHETTVSFSVPETWVDAFILEYRSKIPRWIERRLTVKYKKLTRQVEARAMLPGVPAEAFGDPVYFCVAQHYLDTPSNPAKPQPERSTNEK